MSYSVCLKCGRVVGYYDKYCPICQQEYGLPYLPDFQRTWNPQPGWQEAAKAEVARDMTAALAAQGE